MKEVILFTIFSSFLISGISQTTIKGRVTDQWGERIPGANTMLEGTYDGAMTDSKGHFIFTTDQTGEQTILIQCISFQSYRKQINCSGDTVIVEVTLKEEISKLDEVVITAGAFEASDKKKAVMLKPLDIVTTPSAKADIYGTISNLPGAISSSSNGKLIVRGGEPSETRTFINGMSVASPYVATLANVPGRSRFMPFSFDGMMFSSGAYSSEFGGALSAIVDLSARDYVTKNETQVMIMSVGAQFSKNQKWEKSSLQLTTNYANMAPYNSIMKEGIEWEKAPEAITATAVYTTKLNKNADLKAYIFGSSSSNSIIYNHFDTGNNYKTSLKNNYIYKNITYSDLIKNKTRFFSGISFSRDKTITTIKNIQDKEEENLDLHFKAKAKHVYSSRFSLTGGYELELSNNKLAIDNTYDNDKTLDQTYLSNNIFAETRTRITKKLSNQSGVRFESQDKKIHILPRTSFAYKLTDHHLISFAGGLYSQQYKESDENAFNQETAIATHYVINYQKQKENRVLRIELFQKDYKNLPLYTYTQNEKKITSEGHGYAQGIDLFWRDKKTIPSLDYWISYSYTHSERKFKEHPLQDVVNFVPQHSMSLVGKQFFTALNSYISASYNFATGLPYHNPNKAGYMNEKTPASHDVSITYSYLFKIIKEDAYFHISASNLLARKNIYGYELKSTPDENGIFQSRPLWNSNKPFILLVLGITI